MMVQRRMRIGTAKSNRRLMSLTNIVRPLVASNCWPRNMDRVTRAAVPGRDGTFSLTGEASSLGVDGGFPLLAMQRDADIRMYACRNTAARLLSQAYRRTVGKGRLRFEAHLVTCARGGPITRFGDEKGMTGDSRSLILNKNRHLW